MATQPHDALFKVAFTDPVEAASLLRSVLPEPIAQAIDWTTLAVEPGSSVDEALTHRHSDILLRCKAQDTTALLYLVLEHQSTEDSLMAWRLLRYLTRIVDRIGAQRPRAQRLPPVVSIVVHHGPSPWRSPTEVLELFDLPGSLAEPLAPHLPKMTFILDDLTAKGEAAIGRRAMTTFADLTLRMLRTLPRSPDPLPDLQRWLPLVRAMLSARSGLDRFRAVIEYIRSVADIEDGLLAFARQLGPEAEEVVVTAAERLRSEGREDGRREGHREGRREGRREERAQFLLELLTGRFGPLSPEQEARVRGTDLPTLERWSRQFLAAESLEQALL